MPNPDLSLRVTLPEGGEEWKPIDEVLGTRLLAEHRIATPARTAPNLEDSFF